MLGPHSREQPASQTIARPAGPPPWTGLPPVPDPHNVYAAAGAGMLSPEARLAKPLVYVPPTKSRDVWVIDPSTFAVVARYPLGDGELQHVVPSWDLRTLYASHDLGDRLTPFDPTTGTPGTPIPITDPYNVYFTPDGRTAVFTCEFAGRVDVVDVAAHRLLRMIEALRHEPGRYSLGHTGITR